MRSILWRKVGQMCAKNEGACYHKQITHAVISKLHISKLFSSVNPHWSQIYKISPNTNVKQNTNTEQIFQEMVPLILPLFKTKQKHTGHMLVSSTIPSDLWVWDYRNIKNKERTETEKFTYIYKCIYNGKHQCHVWQQAAHTNHHTSCCRFYPFCSLSSCNIFD